MKPLDDGEIEATLIDNGLGVLSLVDGTAPYAIPMSFGYGDGLISFMMQRGDGDGSRKLSLLESSPNACLTVYEHDAESNRWKSVIVFGELYEIPESEEGKAFFNLADNAAFAPGFDVLDLPTEEIDLRYVGLDIGSISGREYTPPAEGE